MFELYLSLIGLSIVCVAVALHDFLISRQQERLPKYKITELLNDADRREAERLGWFAKGMGDNGWL